MGICAMISLIIKGGFNEAVNAAMQHDVVIGDLRRHEKWGYTLATCDDMHLPQVIKWYSTDMNLLLYSQKDADPISAA